MKEKPTLTWADKTNKDGETHERGQSRNYSNDDCSGRITINRTSKTDNCSVRGEMAERRVFTKLSRILYNPIKNNNEEKRKSTNSHSIDN
jgi:hypothetical protein